MDQLIIVVLNGVLFASYLFLVSAGLTFIYGVMRILNVAHGSLYGLGAYMGAWLVLLLWPGGLGGLPSTFSYIVLLIAGIVVGIAVGPLLERVVGGNIPAAAVFLALAGSASIIRADVPVWLKLLVPVAAAGLGVVVGRYIATVYPTRTEVRGEVIPLILTFALFLILDDVMKLTWGVDPLLADMPYSQLGSISMARVSFPVYQLLLPLVALLAAAVMWFIINRTRFGKLVICVIADREVSGALGVDVPRIYTFAFTLGAILAAVGGAFIAPMTSVVPGISVEVIILAFAVTTIGGLGSVPGAAIGSAMVGLLRALAVQYRPELDLFVIYALMTLILLIKPRGLFGGFEVRRI